MNIKEKIKRINDSILRYRWSSFVSACFKKLRINLNLLDNIQKFFDIKWIKTQSRNFSQYKILNKFSDDEKWLMMSESRPQTMQWLICEPKK